MSQTKDPNKRIAINSIYMSIRMVFVLCITLYTTRVVLDALGIVDYGIYNVVCGFASMFTFLNTSMSNGIQRFFNFEYGKNGIDGAKKVYNAGLLIQIILAIIIIISCETIGVWYLYNKMVIPPDRIIAAMWVFQFSILSFVFVILKAPYSASVMAHEKMGFYSVLSIIEVVFKLAIVLLIPYLPGDSLIIYGVLFALISFIDFFSFYLYSKINFEEIKINKSFDKCIIKSMLGFSGWNIFGSFSNMMKEQGINLVLNFFCGPIVNAARGVANQVNGGIQGFVTNILIPVRPQIIQSFASGNTKRTLNLTYSVSKLSCLFLYLICVPIMLEIKDILSLWLKGNVPNHTESFVIIIIATAFISNLNASVSGVVHASGKMKKYQLATTFCSLLCIPLSYIVLYNHYSPELALSMVFLSMLLVQAVSLLVLKTIIKYSIKDYIKSVILPVAWVIALTLWISILIKYRLQSEPVRFLLIFLCHFFSVSYVSYVIALNKSEKELIRKFIKREHK